VADVQGVQHCESCDEMRCEDKDKMRRENNEENKEYGHVKRSRTENKTRLEIDNKCGVSDDIKSEVTGLEDRSVSKRHRKSIMIRATQATQNVPGCIINKM
jgi:hypothetical protein